jgi:hypothetical protein
MKERNWDTIYWAVDLHGVCLESNYEQGGYRWINQSALRVLRKISSLPETKIILWSSVYSDEKSDIIGFFNDNGIEVYDFNANDGESNTRVSSFDEKFYFSVLLDDKAGFDPETDWVVIEKYLEGNKMESEKPVVHYIGKPYGLQLGGRCYLDEVVDHPRLGHCHEVSTSGVVRIEPNTGIFETYNTVYKPVQQLNG